MAQNGSFWTHFGPKMGSQNDPLLAILNPLYLFQFKDLAGPRKMGFPGMAQNGSFLGPSRAGYGWIWAHLREDLCGLSPGPGSGPWAPDGPDRAKSSLISEDLSIKGPFGAQMSHYPGLAKPEPPRRNNELFYQRPFQRTIHYLAVGALV